MASTLGRHERLRRSVKESEEMWKTQARTVKLLLLKLLLLYIQLLCRKSILDWIRNGQLDEVLATEFIQRNIRKLTHGAYPVGALNLFQHDSWSISWKYILSISTLGLLAPVLLKKKKGVEMDWGPFWDDITSIEVPCKKSEEKEADKGKIVPAKNPITRYFNNLFLFLSTPKVILTYMGLVLTLRLVQGP